MKVKKYKFPFNSERYLKLKKKKGQDLEKSENQELSNYYSQIFNYLCWQDKDNFLILIENFLNSELECVDFDIQFYQLHLFK